MGRRRTRAEATTVRALALAAVALAARPAGADMVYELTPMTALGATTNAEQTIVPVADAIFSLGNIARLRYQGPRTGHMLGYRLIWTRFLERGSDAFINELTATSSFNLSPQLDLSLSAIGRLSTTTQIDFADPTTVVPQSSVAGSQAYLYTTVGESLIFQPTPRWRFLETVSASRVHYLSAPEGMATLPTVTSILGLLRADLLADRNGFFLETRVTDFYVDGVPPMGSGFVAQGHSFIGQAMVGWRRELTPSWASVVQGGPSAIWRGGDFLLAQPAASAGVQYRHEQWFATLTAAHVPAINLFSGLTTVNEQVILRIAVPVTRNEALVLAGFASYIYARMADANGNLQRAYDQRYVGAVVTSRFGRTSFYGSFSYGLVHQNGGVGNTGPVPDLVRQTALLSLIGYLNWGPAPPPVYGGATM